jgi:hypothetical protein
MASKTQHTEKVRKRKHLQNKVNLKTNQRRLAKNYQVLARLAQAD